MTEMVICVGDSSIDNGYWLINNQGSNIKSAEELSVEGQLKNELGDSHEVVNLAFDGFTTQSLLTGDRIGWVLPGKTEPRFQAYIDYKMKGLASKDVKPLEELSKVVKENADKVCHVVISVGGNDFRAHLGAPMKLLGAVPEVQDRYLKILERIKQLKTLNPNVRPILIFQYRTDARAFKDPYLIYSTLGAVALIAPSCIVAIAAFGLAIATSKISIVTGGIFILIAGFILQRVTKVIPLRVTKEIFKLKNPGMVLLGALMEKFYRPILEQAKKDKLPILDLPNSFNPYQDLYISGIEPNQNGGKKIAQGLSHIIKGSSTNPQHDYTTSKIYHCNGSVKENNPEKWRVEYPQKLSKQKVD